LHRLENDVPIPTPQNQPCCPNATAAHAGHARCCLQLCLTLVSLATLPSTISHAGCMCVCMSTPVSTGAVQHEPSKHTHAPCAQSPAIHAVTPPTVLRTTDSWRSVSLILSQCQAERAPGRPSRLECQPGAVCQTIGPSLQLLCRSEYLLPDPRPPPTMGEGPARRRGGKEPMSAYVQCTPTHARTKKDGRLPL
jgi:hypothetical protein